MSTITSGIFSFPNPVNEKAARVVAGSVLVTAVVALGTRSGWLLWLLALGFLLRVLSGPRFSPYGLLATRVVAPRLGEPKLVAGPPKRFAQGMGFVISLVAAALVTAGASTPGWLLVGALVVAAGLEAFLAICLGCLVFGRLQRAGLVPESVCAECEDIWSRRPA